MVQAHECEIIASDLKDASRRLPEADEEQWKHFAVRQLRARRRLADMARFYHACPCYMARTHLLAANAIALGRFCGFSASYDRLGEALSPVMRNGEPRSALWMGYRTACSEGRPWEIRDELWLAAHMADFEAVRKAGMDREFYAEANMRTDDPTWQLLRRHMEVTLGARMIDRAAIAGMVAYETAIARTMRHGVAQLLKAGHRLLMCYAWETARALLAPFKEPDRGLFSYRRCAIELIRYSVTAWTASKTFRRGIRARDRGVSASENSWPLLAEVLGDRMEEVHPLIHRFYTNPSDFDVTASLQLHTLPARFWSRLATLLTGQGLFESSLDNIPARFRVFRREDGSMHFVRELYCKDTLRVFDSDFVVREVNGRPTLSEVFVDLRTEVIMEVMPMGDGGVRIQSAAITFWGWRMPAVGIQVAFETQVLPGANGEDILHITGNLLMQPKSGWGKFFAYKILRRPELLGRLQYEARPRPADPARPPGTTDLSFARPNKL